MRLQIKFRVQPIKELSLGSPALWMDWARNPDHGYITIGVATRDGKLFIINPETWTQKDVVVLDPPTPIWRVVGNHHTTPTACDFALATLNAGVLGIKAEKGVVWQHPFGSSCGAITFAHRKMDGKQLIVAGGLDKTLRGMDPVSGKLVWGQVFLEGVGFVDIFDVGQETFAVAGDAAGNVRCFDAFTGVMRWHGEFRQNARFCVPILGNTGNGSQWIVGTDEKKLHCFQESSNGTVKILNSLPVKEYPWQARMTSNSTIVSIYDFANLGESASITPGEIMALSPIGQELWKETTPGSAEDFEVIPGETDEDSRILVATNAGTIVSLNAQKGTILDKLHLGETPVNCIKFWQSPNSSELALAVACDDGRVIRVQRPGS